MSKGYRQKCFIIALLLFYCLLFYLISIQDQLVDFSSFYSAINALIEGDNPYKNLMSTYLPTNKLLPANVNPPFVLLSFIPLMKFSYFTGMTIWLTCSLILGLIGVTITFYYAFSPQFLKNNRLNLYLFYLAFFGTLMNVVTLQLGSVLLFFIMFGYHCYLRNRDSVAGIFWGIIIAMKLFPALLFFYVLKQGRYKVFAVMCITLILAWLFPLFLYGTVIYKQYFAMMPNVFWYGDSWNASIYGFLFRLFFDNDTLAYLIPIEVSYIILFCFLLLFYLKKLGPIQTNPINHQPFCLTLVMMLLLSPFGWVYYFPILLFPLLLTLCLVLDQENATTSSIVLWLLSFFLINFPQDYVESKRMIFGLSKISVYSTYFYGLLLLVYMLAKRKKIYGNNELQINEYLLTLGIITAFGIAVPTIYFILRVLKLTFNLS